MKNANARVHVMHYMILIFILVIGLLTFSFFAGYPDRQFLVAIGTSISYFIWGIIHHQAEGDLHPKIMVEYLLISLLAIILLRGAIYH